MVARGLRMLRNEHNEQPCRKHGNTPL